MDSSSFSLANVAAAIGFFTLLLTIFFFFYTKFRSHQETETMEENKTVASSSLVPSSSPRNLKHHVFPSFHGADVRRAFLSHILKEFGSKAIDLFIDNSIERSKSIGPELIDAIRGSRIAIVLLSKNYASSTWCLDELVEIIRCREVLGQTVMVIFYEVDPTDVKKETGDFGKVFRKTCKGKTEHDIRRWKQALAEVATIAGYHSRNWDNEAKMIGNIAIDVSNKLNLSTPSRDFDNLVGMETHMLNMGPLLRLDLKEVRMIGIWGPSGIGKTTIARFLFNRHSQDFQLSVFMENIKARYPIRSCSDDYNVKLELQEQFMSKVINQKGFKIPHLGIVEDRLKDKKVFIVLDDVDHLFQLEAMAKETWWFGPSSRIIITTQDRRLLEAGGFNHIYKVGLPSSSEAFQMFCTYAFGHKYPKDGFEELAWEVTRLVGELPLGLKVMGSYFRGMSNQEDWQKALPRLRTHLDGEIESILKLSYDALDDEDKNLFLHIACFFTDESVDIVEACLSNSLLIRDVKHGLGVIERKSLISLDEGWVRMHDLLIRLGREIVRKQSVSDPGKRQFLVNTRDFDEVLSDNKADTSSVIGIDILACEEEIIALISERTLERFYNLQFLRIRDKCVNLRRLDSLPRKLRYLFWDEFPLPCLPSDFQTKFLVKLLMRESKLVKLWDGIQPLNNLKVMDLRSSRYLRVLPDLSTAINLYELDIEGCESLVELPSIGTAVHLQKLRLSRCSSLVKLHPSIGNAIHLRELDFSYCLSLEQLPSSIGNLINLGKLDFKFCSNLVELPISIGNLINLKELKLWYCSSLVELPSSIGNLINLRELGLTECKNLVELTSSVGNLINLETLVISGCSSLIQLPSSMRNLVRLSKLELRGCLELKVCLTNINLESLKELDLSDCSWLNIEDLKPNGIVPLLSESELSSCETQELSPLIKRISRLGKLVLSGMQNLVSLPQLPYSIEDLVAMNCESLERLDCSFRNPEICLNFAKCYKLNEEARDLIIHTRTNKFAVLPGEEVPACFTYRASGNYITVNLDQKPLRTSTKFKACIIINDEEDFVLSRGKVYCSITSQPNALCISPWKELYEVYPKHLYTFEVEAMEVTSTELVFEFEFHNSYNITWEIKECGIFQLDREASGERQHRDQEEHAKSTELVCEDDNKRQLPKDCDRPLRVYTRKRRAVDVLNNERLKSTEERLVDSNN